MNNRSQHVFSFRKAYFGTGEQALDTFLFTSGLVLAIFGVFLLKIPEEYPSAKKILPTCSILLGALFFIQQHYQVNKFKREVKENRLGNLPSASTWSNLLFRGGTLLLATVVMVLQLVLDDPGKSVSILSSLYFGVLWVAKMNSMAWNEKTRVKIAVSKREKSKKGLAFVDIIEKKLRDKVKALNDNFHFFGSEYRSHLGAEIESRLNQVKERIMLSASALSTKVMLSLLNTQARLVALHVVIQLNNVDEFKRLTIMQNDTENNHEENKTLEAERTSFSQR